MTISCIESLEQKISNLGTSSSEQAYKKYLENCIQEINTLVNLYGEPFLEFMVYFDNFNMVDFLNCYMGEFKTLEDFYRNLLKRPELPEDLSEHIDWEKFKKVVGNQYVISNGFVFRNLYISQVPCKYLPNMLYE